MVTGTGSSLAQTRFAQPHHPTNKSLQQSSVRPPVQLNPALAGGGRFVDFAPPIYHEHEGFYFSDSQEGGGNGSEGSFEGDSAEELQQGAGFDEDDEEEEEEEEEDSQDPMEESVQGRDEKGGENSSSEGNVVQGHPIMHFVEDRQDPLATVDDRALQPLSGNTRAAQAQQQIALGVGRPAQIQNTFIQPDHSQPQPPTIIRMASVDERLRLEQEAQNSRSALAPATHINITRSLSSSSTTPSSRLKPFVDEHGDITNTGLPSADGMVGGKTNETRKISLTPKIARDDSAESNLSERALSPTPSNSSASVQQSGQPQVRQPFRNISSVSSTASVSVADRSEATTPNLSNGSAFNGESGGPNDFSKSEHLRRGSAASSATASSTVSSVSTSKDKDSNKRSVSPANPDAGPKEPKKKKSTGILGGFFSRGKKDKEKKEKNAPAVDSSAPVAGRKSSSSTLSSDERGSKPASPAPDSPEKNGPAQGIVSQQIQQRRASETARDEMFGTDAALRQQQIEAKNAMFHQYGIHPRSARDVSNTSTFSALRSPTSVTPQQEQHESSQASILSPSSASIQGALNSSQSGHNASGKRRPGSLIGSPHMAGTGTRGADVPVLNVLRVFAGENIVSEATFKTVLLNESTTTEALIKQAMQRFRLAPPPESSGSDGIASTASIMSEYYLTAKEVSGDETWLEMGQNPLKVFESLSKANSGFGLPSVKRSSVGSINSIASNLSLNPAIEKLRMSDFSDDSAVKLFVNKRTPDEIVKSRAPSEGGERISEDGLFFEPNRLSATGSILDKGPAPGMPSSPMLRFAIKLIIHPEDLPESMVFDPSSPAIIPKSTLSDRQLHRSVLGHSQTLSTGSSTSSALNREKIIFFPRNANVSEVLETALDRFGIVEGVVDGGDEVEDKLAKRRSINRVRYCLAMRQPDQPGGGKPLQKTGVGSANRPHFRNLPWPVQQSH